MDRKVVFLAVLVVICAVTPGLRAQERPLQTPDAETVPAGTLRAQGGFDFLQSVDYPLSGLSGDQTAVGVLDLRLGVGNRVEVQLQGTLENFLQIHSEVPAPIKPILTANNSTHDIGDFSLWTKIHVRDEHRAPAFAFRFGFLMPNSDQSRGIGNNTTNVYATGIAEKHFRRMKVFGSAGIGILQAPNAQYSQNDVLLYGGAFEYRLSRRLQVVGEVSGHYSGRALRPALYGTENRGQGRMGIVISAGGFRWDAAAIAGVYPNDPSTGFTFGVSRDLRLFRRHRNHDD